MYIILRPHALLKGLGFNEVLAGANDMRQSLSLLLILLSILSINCGSKPNLNHPIYIKQESGVTPLHTIPVYIDIKFCNSDKKSIKKAIDNWNESLNGYLILNIVSTNFKESPDSINKVIKEKGYVILQIYSDNKIISERDDGKSIVIGLANELGGNIMHLVRDRLTENDITAITMHELGHLLGADHTVEKYLMSTIYSEEGYKCIDIFTIKQVAVHWYLPLQRLNYCVYN